MIRRDYILRMIEEFTEALARINASKHGQKWDEATGDVDTQFKQLIGINPQAILQMSETEILARTVHGEPTHLARDKILMVTTLLKESGDIAQARDRTVEAHGYYLKSLHLLLDTLGRGEIFECPEFVPKVQALREALEGLPLPVRTQAMLMQHFERNGGFAKAEDALFAMLEAEPEPNGVVEFGVAFYQRLLDRTDAALIAGALPRAEVAEGLRGLRDRQKPGSCG